MSRVSNLPQLMSQISVVEKVQQVQQAQGDLEQSRLAGQAQKEVKRKRRTVPDTPPSETVELLIPDRKEDKRNKRKGRDRAGVRVSTEEEDPEEERKAPPRHVDLRV